jgi:hypothetical protein
MAALMRQMCVNLAHDVFSKPRGLQLQHSLGQKLHVLPSLHSRCMVLQKAMCGKVKKSARGQLQLTAATSRKRARPASQHIAVESTPPDRATTTRSDCRSPAALHAAAKAASVRRASRGKTKPRMVHSFSTSSREPPSYSELCLVSHRTSLM